MVIKRVLVENLRELTLQTEAAVVYQWRSYAEMEFLRGLASIVCCLPWLVD